MRIGTQYRIKSFKTLGLHWSGRYVLDIGCHDGAFLASLATGVRIGVDLKPTPSFDKDVIMIQADGVRLPFCSGCFDHVVATDVIEHLSDPSPLVHEMCRVVREGGKLFLTTPSADICVFPPFLTSWVSIKWGHYWRRGYTSEELLALFDEEFSCKLSEWAAPAYRFFYLLLRALAAFSPNLVACLLDRVSDYDTRHSDGKRGFYWLRCIKN